MWLNIYIKQESSPFKEADKEALVLDQLPFFASTLMVKLVPGENVAASNLSEHVVSVISGH